MKRGLLGGGILVALVFSCHADQTSLVYRVQPGTLALGQSVRAVDVQGPSATLVGAEPVLAAMQLYEAACDKGLQITKLDVSAGEYITFIVAGGRQCRFSWREMGKDTELSAVDLSTRLARLVALLRIPQGNQVRAIDLTDSPPETPRPEVRGDEDNERSGVNPSARTAQYKVNEGQDLATVAAMFGVSVSELRKANNFDDSHRVTVGQTILVPIKVP